MYTVAVSVMFNLNPFNATDSAVSNVLIPITIRFNYSWAPVEINIQTASHLATNWRCFTLWTLVIILDIYGFAARRVLTEDILL